MEKRGKRGGGVTNIIFQLNVSLYSTSYIADEICVRSVVMFHNRASIVHPPQYYGLIIRQGEGCAFYKHDYSNFMVGTCHRCLCS